MLQRQRIYELILGDAKTKDAVKITNLQVKFDISKSSDNKKSANSATIEIYNLSNATLDKLKTDYLACSISCGYQDTGLINLLIGQVVMVTTRKDGTDKVTQLQIGEGYVELNQQYLKGLTPMGGTVEETIEEIRKQMPGVVRGAYTGLNIKSQVMYGYPLTGTPREMLNEIAEAYRLEYRVDRNGLYVTDEAGLADKNLNTAFVLSENSGLVDIPYKASAEGRKLKGDKTKRQGIHFKALLNGKIIPGSPIRLESEAITGWYKVKDVRYYGGFNDNDWYVEGLCEEIKVEDIPK